MLNRILCLSLLVVPVIVVPGWGDGIRAPKEALSIIFLSLIVGIFFTMGKSIKKNVPLLCLAGWCILMTSLPMLTIPLGTDKIVINIPGQLIACKSLVYIIIGTLSIIALSSVHIDTNKAFKMISYIALGLTVYVFIQALGMDEFFRAADLGTGWVSASVWFGNKADIADMSRRIVATVGNPSILGIFFAMIFPIILHMKKYVLAGLMVIAILLTVSATAYACTIIGALVYTLFTSKKAFFVLLTFCFLLLCVAMLKHDMIKSMINPTGRVEVLTESLKQIEKKPLTGLGLGSFEYRIGLNEAEVRILKGESWKEMHNEYGQAWFETGFVGLMLFLWVIYDSIRKRIFNMTRDTQAIFASLVVLLLASGTYFCFRIAPISYYGVVLTGMFLNTGEVT